MTTILQDHGLVRSMLVVLVVSSTLLNVWIDEYKIEEIDHPAQMTEENTGNKIPPPKTILAESDDKGATSGVG
jgi:hypothetical protein